MPRATQTHGPGTRRSAKHSRSLGGRRAATSRSALAGQDLTTRRGVPRNRRSATSPPAARKLSVKVAIVPPGGRSLRRSGTRCRPGGTAKLALWPTAVGGFMFAFARFVARAFMRSSERTPQNYTGTPSSLAAIRIADGVCPKCNTHPRARARVLINRDCFGNRCCCKKTRSDLSIGRAERRCQNRRRITPTATT
jgi:hypothetical protein